MELQRLLRISTLVGFIIKVMQRQRHYERANCAIMLTCSHLSFSKAEENISARRRPFRNWTRRVEVNHRLQHFFVRMFPKGFGLNLFIL